MLTYRSELPKKEDIYKFYETIGWNKELGLSAQELLFAMKGSFHCIFVYDDEKLIATGRIISDGVTNAYMCGIGVLPEYQNHGLGREIVNKLSQFAKDHSLKLQFICTEEMKPYYEKIGFTTFGAGMKL